MATNTYKILPRLHVRNHLDKEKDLKRWIRSRRIDLVIGLAPPIITCLEDYVNYVYHPIRDGKPGKKLIKYLKELARWIARKWRRGKRIVIHCRMGRSRSCLLAALTVMRIKGCSGRDALAYMRKVRPRCLSRNRHFIKLLEEL
jgi:protein-tyrosine phosphatase